MSAVFQAAGVAVVCAVLALTLKKDSAPLGWCLALAGGLVILWLGLDTLREGFAELSALLAMSGLNGFADRVDSDHRNNCVNLAKITIFRYLPLRNRVFS